MMLEIGSNLANFLYGILALLAFVAYLWFITK
jgi:hypothetical protein